MELKVDPAQPKRRAFVAGLCARCGGEVIGEATLCGPCTAMAAARNASAGQSGLPDLSGQTAVPARPNFAVYRIIQGFVLFRVVFAVVGLAVAGTVAWRVSKAFHLTADAIGPVSPEESVTVTGTEVGTDIYPGAEPGPGGVRRVEGGSSITNGIFLTPDPLDKVIEYYSERVGRGGSTMKTANGAVIVVRREPAESVTVTVSDWPGENSGKTRIAILHTKWETPQ
jgi:hypothetical protein